MDTLSMPPGRRWPPRGVAADGLAAVILAVFTVVEVAGAGFGPRTLAIMGLGVVMAASLTWRRVAPLPALAVATAAYTLLAVIDVASDDLNSVTLTFIVAIYSVAAWERRSRALIGAAAAVAATISVIIGQGPKGEDFVFAALVLGAVWGLGRAMRARLLQVKHMTETAVRLELAREQEAAVAVAAERARIARELHDIVSHGLSVMVVQAAGAEGIVLDDPSKTAEALRSIQDVGRQAQAEMSRMLGLLREDPTNLGLAPQPGIDDVAALVEQARRSGVPIELHVDGSHPPLPASLELTAYRIVQEALTNVRHHAEGAATKVHIGLSDDVLLVEIENATANGILAPRPGSGHGLIGMRERAAMCGGTLSASPLPGGGFRVLAELPVATA